MAIICHNFSSIVLNFKVAETVISMKVNKLNKQIPLYHIFQVVFLQKQIYITRSFKHESW
jgi:hypothetical protein